jgi:hypothetical protein
MAPNATLQQVDIIVDGYDLDGRRVWQPGRHVFRFGDRANGQEMAVIMPASGTPPEAWEIQTTPDGPYAGGLPRPFDLGTLRIGPGRAIGAMEQAWPGIRVHVVSLVSEGGGFVWYVFGTVPEGHLSGRLNHGTGTFEILGPGPTKLRPEVATPSSQ